jgi:phosphoribosyl 1,2-cyclic phosphate phosphodiesterase
VEKGTGRRKLTLLGTGTSQGVPVIGCSCVVCSSTDPRDQRLRSAALYSDAHLNILIDVGPDFRQQMLREHIQHLDAILLTHEHNDHVIGLDDIRPFNYRSGHPMAVFALPRVAAEVRKRFEYVFGDPIPGLPRIQLMPIDKDVPMHFDFLTVQPVGIMHGLLPIVGFRFGDMAYLTDVKYVPEEEWPKLSGVRYLVVSALHHKGHAAHMNLTEALAFIERLQPEKAWLTHISHHMGLAAEVEPSLPTGVFLAYDGLHICY